MSDYVKPKDLNDEEIKAEIKTKFRNIIHPNNTRYQYGALELKNGIRALLISCPDTDIAGGSLDVKAGSMRQPREFEGLAHLVEHIIFTGNEQV